MGKEKIGFDKFLEIANTLEIKLGLIVESARIPKTDKLLQLKVAFGDPNTCELKTCVTNLGGQYEPEDFKNGVFNFVTNLKPQKLGGILSEVMIMVPRTVNDEGVEKLYIHDFVLGSSIL